jgi:hypothetical protein
MKRAKPHVPVLLMTGDSGGEFVAGVEFPILRKPFTDQQLVDAVRDVLR